MITEDQINKAYNELLSVKQEFEIAEMTAVNMKAELDSMFDKAIASGELVGKNDTERKGAFALAYQDLVDALRTRQSLAKEAKLRLDLANIEVSRVRALLRLAEVLACLEPEKEEE